MILKKGLKPALCSDHAGYELKGIIEGYLLSKDIECDDFGTHSAESCDYADFAHPCADAVETGKNYPGIAMCGSGNGINMTLNKHQGIRAGLCWIPEVAHVIRQHNKANGLVMPGRFIDNDMAKKIMDEFLNTEFEGGRHIRRIEKIPVSK